MVDNMYPDNLPPEFGIPLCLMLLALYIKSVVKERRTNQRGTN